MQLVEVGGGFWVGNGVNMRVISRFSHITGREINIHEWGVVDGQGVDVTVAGYPLLPHSWLETEPSWALQFQRCDSNGSFFFHIFWM